MRISHNNMTCSWCRKIGRLKMELDFAIADYQRSTEGLRLSVGIETVRRQDARHREVKRLLKKLQEARKAYDEAMADFKADPYQCSFYRRPENAVVVTPAGGTP